MKKAYYEIPGPSSDDGAQKQFHLDWGSANHWAMPHQQPGPVQTVDKQDSVYCLTLPRQSKVSAKFFLHRKTFPCLLGLVAQD